MKLLLLVPLALLAACGSSVKGVVFTPSASMSAPVSAAPVITDTRSTGDVDLSDSTAVTAKLVPPATGYSIGTSDTAVSAQKQLAAAFPAGDAAAVQVFDDGTGRLVLVIAVETDQRLPDAQLADAAKNALVGFNATDYTPLGDREAVASLGTTPPGAVGVVALPQGFLIVLGQGVDETFVKGAVAVEAAALGITLS